MDFVNMTVNCLLTWRGKVGFYALKGTREANNFLIEYIVTFFFLF